MFVNSYVKLEITIKPNIETQINVSWNNTLIDYGVRVICSLFSEQEET